MPEGNPRLFRIDYDMMLKGSICKRRKGVVRQVGVTVNGSTRLVTSGDVVDLDTYNALVVAGAIRPKPGDPVPPSRKRSGMDFAATESAED